MATHALFWLLNGEHLEAEARVAIREAQDTNEMYVSAVSGWEAAVAVRKKSSPPNLGGLDANEWFQEVLNLPGARLVGLPRKIACEAAAVPATSLWNDPFDCLLIATARIKRIPIVTRDAAMRALVRRNPSYLRIIVC
jgi:PIN domain nuclease of toxin-antitoxin system